MATTLNLLFTHNEEYEKVKNYIRAFQKSLKNKEEIILNNKVVDYKMDSVVLKAFVREFDGLILTGGKDINPRRYGANQIHPATKIMGEKKEFIDFKLIELFLEQKKHILGICLGCQELAVFFGGSLYQDIPDQLKSNLHRNGEKDSIHPVKIEKESRLFQLVKMENCKVVSHHHQCIKEVGRGLKINAISPEDKVIEGIELENNQQIVVGVQWHPERDVDTNEASKNLFENFIDKLLQLRK